ncbi:MAG: phytanoyl-CoA dioxygenase family protein [Rubrivivax sp.]|nr:phytanoyl-CoA dioxygenase family protein [Rubrivivax sp.]
MLTYADPATPLPTLLDRLHTDGYFIIPSLLPAGQVQAIRAALAPWLQNELPGRNDFEGYRSERVYALLAKSPVFAELAAHPLVLDVCEAVLGPNFMLSACLAINTHPGETVQPLHFDDSFYHVPRPRPAYGVSVFWPIDEFTAENGATEIIPGSHRWGDEVPVGAAFEKSFMPGFVAPEEHHPGLEPAVMPAGSLMITMGTLWHRGGANRSAGSRLVITPQYCVAWGRQMESMLLAVPPEIVASYPERVQQLLGYSIHPPFMGHVNGMHPKRTLPMPGAGAAKEPS